MKRPHRFAVAIRKAWQHRQDQARNKLFKPLDHGNLWKKLEGLSVQGEGAADDVELEFLKDESIQEMKAFDERTFTSLLDLKFTRVKVSEDHASGVLHDCFQPNDKDVLERLDQYYYWSEFFAKELTSLRKSLKGQPCQPLREKGLEWVEAIRVRLDYGKRYTAAQVLTHYIGGGMVGLSHIPKFKVFINGKVKTITIKARKDVKEDWRRVMEKCEDYRNVVHCEVDRRKRLHKKLCDVWFRHKLCKYSFFLQEICCPWDMFTACECLMGDDFQVFSTIPLPDPKKKVMFKAFYKIMKKQDLSRFRLANPDFMVEVVVYEENLPYFLTKLEESRVPENNMSSLNAIAEARKMEKLRGLQQQEAPGRPERDLGPTELDRLSINPNSPAEGQEQQIQDYRGQDLVESWREAPPVTDPLVRALFELDGPLQE